MNKVLPGKTPSETTAIIQREIDKASQKNGGKIVLRNGYTYEIGTIELRSNIELFIEKGAVLRASREPSDYLQLDVAGQYGGNKGGFLLQGTGLKNVTISGKGIIDGRCLEFMDGWRDEEQKYIRSPKEWRPRCIGFFNCSRVRILDIKIVDSAQWTIHLTGCDNVEISGLFIKNRLDVPNCDGIDPDHCKNVRIKDCYIESGDDSIVIKNTKENQEFGACENIYIDNCTLMSTSSAVKIGTESWGVFRNIVVSNCRIKSSHRGLAIQVRDPGLTEHIHFSDCSVETRLFNEFWWGRAEPIYVTALSRDEGGEIPRVRDVSFKNINCTSERGVFICGDATLPLCNISLHNISLQIKKKSKWSGRQHDLRPIHSKEHGGLLNELNRAVYIKNTDEITLDSFSIDSVYSEADVQNVIEFINVDTLKIIPL